MARFSEKYEAGMKFKVTTSNNPKGIAKDTVLTWTGEERWYCGSGWVPKMRGEDGNEFTMRPYYLALFLEE